ncbi:hypothetical protein B0H14DRAFT_2559106 [Mycena olivaceomarginata]|nr:hypothetical protein B0H14DRAFT_2559106 [Mycena olivaceomarginata]
MQMRRRTGEQREQADGKGADSQPTQARRRTSEQREQANGKGADSQPMQREQADSKGADSQPTQARRRTSEQREQGDGKRADSQATQARKRTGEQREQADGKGADSQAMQARRRTGEQREQADGKGADSQPTQARRRTGSDRWLDPSTYVQSTETISEACSAALIDHDYTYYMDEADKKWLDDTNNGCCVEEAIVHERRAGCTPILISADEFELVMGLFEILTGPKLRSQHQLSDFSFFQPFFQAPLHPNTFASHVVPAWVPPPSVLTSIAVIIHQHWQQRRSFRGGHKIFPLLNNDARDCINDAYGRFPRCRSLPDGRPPQEPQYGEFDYVSRLRESG